MANSIGSNLETQIILDASGVRTGAQRGVEAMQMFEMGAERLGDSLSDIGSRSEAMNRSIERAAGLVELLSAKMLAASDKQRSYAKNAMSFGDQMASTQPTFGDRMAGFQMPGDKERAIRQAEKDAEERAAAMARAARRAQARLDADAQRFASGAGRDPLMTNRNTISANFRAVAQTAVEWERGRKAVDSMEKSIRRMKEATNPLLAMQNRLADEAEEFKTQVQLALKAQILTKEQAEEITAEYQKQSAALLLQTRQQQQGFLGMRQFGFAAQQAGYAIEDAAAMYGTMGAAGAFRAASNNLTAMAAGFGPLVGVATSLAAAAAAIGLHLWESSKAAEEATKSEEKLLKTREDLLGVQERMIEHEQTLRDLRRASSGADVQSAIQAQLDAAIKADAAAREKVRRAPILAIEAEIESIQAQMAALPGRQFGGGPAVDVSGAASQRQRVELANQLTELQERRIKLYEQEGILLKKMDSDEQKFAERQRERELAYTRSLEVRNTKIVEAFAPEQRDTQIGLMQEMQKLEAERLALANGRYKTEVDLINAMTQHGEILDKQVEVAERMAALRKEGLEAEQNAKEMITGRYEAVNEELKFTNDQTKARKELNEQIQKGLDAGTMSIQQAEKLRAEQERILKIERENRDAEKALEKLKKRESKLEELMSGRSREASVMAATFAGTDEAARIIEQERLRVLQQNDQKPMLDELKGIRKAIEKQKEILEKNANATPDPVAALF